MIPETEAWNVAIEAFYSGETPFIYTDMNGKDNIVIRSHDSIYTPDTLKYHSSWNWLMPVVEKIEDMYDSPIEIFSNHCRVIKPIQGQIRGDTKIQATWQAVVYVINQQAERVN